MRWNTHSKQSTGNLNSSPPILFDGISAESNKI